MKSHTLASSVAIVVTLSMLAWHSQPVRAASIMSFRLTNQGSESIGRVDINILPPGAVVPPTIGTDSATGLPITDSPLVLLGSSTGFDTNLFSIALGTKPDAQVLRLLFGQTQTVDGNGNVSFSQIIGSNGQPSGLFGPGAQLDFALSIQPEMAHALRLELPEVAGGLLLQGWPVTDVTVTPADNGTPGGAGGSGNPSSENQVTQVPEPVSLVLWSGLIGFALSRARKLRRV